MTVKYNLSTVEPAVRVGVSRELTALGVLFNLHDGVLSVSDADEEAVDAVIAKHEQIEEVLESMQQTAKGVRAGTMSPNCEICGRVPAAHLELRRQVGMVVVMTTYRSEIIACEDCATAAYREFQKQTAIKGWTGVRSALMNPVVLAANANAIKKHRDEIASLKLRSQK
jgi:hypothetical protein